MLVPKNPLHSHARVDDLGNDKRAFRNRLDRSLSLALNGNISPEALGVDASTRKAQSIGSELSAMKRLPKGLKSPENPCTYYVPRNRVSRVLIVLSV